jgi:hypothetical protein
MYVEIREYEAASGRLDDLIARFREHTLSIWRRLGIRHGDFHVHVIGGESNALVYWLFWGSLADRERLWSSFLADEEWRRIKADTEQSGPLLLQVRNRVLVPVLFADAPGPSSSPST